MRAKMTFAAVRRHSHGWLRFVLLAAGVLGLAAAVPNVPAQTAAQLISARSTALPLPAGGNGDSMNPLISPNGRFVLFDSAACNLVPETGGQLCFQVYLRDLASNTATLVSVNLNGFGGNGNSLCGGMSPDGRYVVFTSDASDLVAGDTNGAKDIFVRDLVAGTTVLASASTSGIEGNADSTSPVITPDGRFVAFLSSATNLVPNDTNGIPDVFVHDLTLQTTVLASVGAYNAGPPGLWQAQALCSGGSPLAITPDGRYVTFASAYGGLVPGLVKFFGDVYVRDLVANQTVWASSNAAALANAILSKQSLPGLSSLDPQSATTAHG